MAGNSSRRGAIRKAGTKKGQVKGTGGKQRRSLEGRGATPKAVDRPYHPAHKRAQAQSRKTHNERRASQARNRRDDNAPELVLGRNPVLECLRAGIPAKALYLASGNERDERLVEIVRLVTDKGLSIIEMDKPDMDRMSSNSMHQGVALQVPPYSYAHPDDLMKRAANKNEAPLIVALDNITDPRNLGAVIRSVAAFGGHGVLIPERRSAAVTPVAWRTSAGAAARLPVAQATNLNRTLLQWAKEGAQLVGLDGEGDVSLYDYDATGPIVIVVGSEGKGLSRLVRENCDTILSIPISGTVESLNASVAAGVVLAEFSRQRGLSA